MRTIKFRGKSFGTGGWVYGSLEVFSDDAIQYARIKFDEPYTDEELGITIPVGHDYLVDPETVGQFTGLYDKNGKEIYEGDLVKYTRYKVRSEYIKEDVIEDVYVVYWNEKKHAFYCTTKFESGGGASGYLVFHDERAKKEEIEVIGNIHDGKEETK